ncbi:MAG: hypothetical protein P1U56_10980 [Saprospiraceae bacterium]|nr:hypothetical protein [Saprospiraceae bacterium]
MSTFTIYLKYIKYVGRNIGKDLEFVFRLNDEEYRIKLDLKHWSKKEYSPLLPISEMEYDSEQSLIKVPISIFVIEDDPTKNDYGKKDKTHRIKNTFPETFEFTHEVEVRERGGPRTKKNIALFEFSFVAGVVKYDQGGNGRLPNISPPIPHSKRYAFLPGSCDIVCLQKCELPIKECIKKCCT